jgi:hypothetical protein
MIPIFRIDSMRVPWGIVMMMVMGSVFLASNASSQNVITDQVAITSEHGKLFGLTSGEGISREFLASGEDVLVIETKGVTGFVQTSTRLLGFSGRLNRWVDLTLPTAEQIIKWKVTSRMIVVQGRKAAYGFQSDRGRWKRESWGAGESLQDSAVKAHIAVMVTNRRALGFSAFTGGFFPRDLPAGNQIQEIEINDNVVILHLSGFMLVFRSGLAIWAELP